MENYVPGWLTVSKKRLSPMLASSLLAHITVMLVSSVDLDDTQAGRRY